MTAMPGRSPKEIVIAALPICLAALVFGVSFGVLAVAARVPAWAAVSMSALVFAGSAQFAAIGVIAAGGGVLTAILAGALLNLRYVATGIASAPSLVGGRFLRPLAAQLVVDESYALAVSAGEAGRPERRTLALTGVCIWVCWTGGTLVGVLLGPVLGDPRTWGLDAAFPACFVALLWPMLRGHHAVRCAIAGAAVALVLAPFTPPGIPLAGAALVGLWLAR